jgi:HK97 family phage major capsid protein
MRHQVDKTLRDFAAAREEARRFHPEVVGRGVDPGRCLGDFLLRVKNADAAGLEKVYGSYRSKTALAEGGGTTGGYLVPPELRYDLMRDVAEFEVLRRFGALVVPMTSSTLNLPLPDATTTGGSGIPGYFGGINLSWTTEAKSRTENAEPKWQEIVLKAAEMSGYALTSNNLLRDAPGLEAVLRVLFARAIAYFEDQAFLNGDGVGKPLGFIQSPAAKAVARQTSGSVTVQDFAKMAAALLPASWNRAVWTLHPTALEKVLQISTVVLNEERSLIWGRPFAITDKASILGTAGDVALFDPGLYVIGDRECIEVAVSNEEPTGFLKNQSVWRLVNRVDGRPWLSSTVTLPGGGTVGSCVVLN